MYEVNCKAYAKQNQKLVNKYIQLDLVYQLANKMKADAEDERALRRIERRMEAIWERQMDIMAELPKTEVSNANRAMKRIRGY